MGRELPALELARRLYGQLADAGLARSGTQALLKAYE